MDPDPIPELDPDPIPELDPDPDPIEQIPILFFFLHPSVEDYFKHFYGLIDTRRLITN